MNETTPDGVVTLEHAECLAACDYAPVVTVNYEFFDNQTVESAEQLVDQLKAGERPHPTRGAPLCSFKDISRQIAGFVDERPEAVDATATGAPTERGVQLAIERRESAPSYAAGDGRTGEADAERAAASTNDGRTSEHDAPLSTAGSDPNNAAKPAGREAK
jgi:NADH-quinone oxidoreductase subunit E